MNEAPNTFRNYKIRRAILRRLQCVEPYALPQSQLLLEATGDVSPLLKEEEFSAALKWLAEKNHIRAFAHEFSEEPGWFITDLGKIALQK